MVIDWGHRDPWQGPGIASASVHLEEEYGGTLVADWRSANWHFISTGYVWTGQVQTEAAPEPEPEPEVQQKPAGRKRKRKRKRRRLVVEIDGEDFVVEDVEQAVALLERAKEVAGAQIAQALASPVRVEHGIKRPSIRTDSDELRPLVREKRAEIVALYDALLRDLEIQYLMAKADEEDEEETLIRFLM